MSEDVRSTAGVAAEAQADGDGAGISRYQWYVALMATAGFSFATMDSAFFTQALTPLSRDLGLGVSLVGLLTSITYLVAGLCTYAVGWTMDRLGRRGAFQATLIGTALGSVLTAVSWGFASLVVFRSLSTGATSAEGVAGQTLVAENSQRRRRGFLMAVQQVGYPIGWFLSAGIALIVLPLWGWRALFLVGVIPALLALAARRWVRESDRFVDLRRARDESAASRPDETAGQGESVYGVDVVRAQQGAFRQLFEPDLRRTTIVLFLATFAMAIGSGAVLLFVPYLVEARGLENSVLNTLIAVGTAGGVVGYLALGHLGDRWGRKWTIVAALLLGSIAIYLLSQSANFGTMLVFEIAFWVFYMGAYAVLYGFITESFPTRVRGAGTGLVTASIWLAHVVTGLVLPVIVLAAGIETAFVLTGSLAGLVSLGLFACCRNIRPGVELEEIAQ